MSGYGGFIHRILTILESHGFPQKQVSLPLEKLYESAFEQGLNFNKVLGFLREKGIDHRKTTEKIIFLSIEATPNNQSPTHFNQAPSTAHETEINSQLDQIMRQFQSGNAEERFGSLVARAKELVETMRPEDLAQINTLVANMSDLQRHELTKKVQDLIKKSPSF